MKITKRQLRKIIRESILNESRHRRPRYNRHDYLHGESEDQVWKAKRALQNCFDALDNYNVTKRSTSQDLYQKVWKMIRDHYGV